MGTRHRFRLSIMGSLTSSDIDFQPETEEVPGQESGTLHLLGLSWQQLSQSTFPSVWVRLLGSHLPPHFPAARRLMSNVANVKKAKCQQPWIALWGAYYAMAASPHTNPVCR